MQSTDHKEDTNNTRKDEIDLGPVLNGIRTIISKTADGFAFMGKAVHHYFTSVILVSVFALLIGIGIYFVQKPVYYSGMVVTSQYLSPIYYHHIISELDLLIKDRNYDELASTLGISKETAKKFKTMYYLPLVVEGDTVENNQPFRVVVASHDGQIFSNLTEPIVQFLEQNEYVQEQRKIRKEQLESSIATLEQEIDQLDSLKKVIEKNLLKENSNTKGFNFEERPDPVSVYEQKMELFNSKQYNKSQLAQIKNIEVIYPFTVRTQADKPNLISILLFALMAGIVIGIIYATNKLSQKQGIH